MQDRRSAFPGHDDPLPRSAIDSPTYTRTENNPIHLVHKRYWALLVVAVAALGLYSFYTPVSIPNALHCDKTGAGYFYALTGGVPSRDSVQPLSDTAAAVLEDYSAFHILQQDAVFDSAEAIVIYPAEDTNYALYATPEASYVFAVDKEKFRYQIRDDGTFYQTLYTALNT